MAENASPANAPTSSLIHGTHASMATFHPEKPRAQSASGRTSTVSSSATSLSTSFSSAPRASNTMASRACAPGDCTALRQASQANRATEASPASMAAARMPGCAQASSDTCVPHGVRGHLHAARQAGAGTPDVALRAHASSRRPANGPADGARRPGGGNETAHARLTFDIRATLQPMIFFLLWKSGSPRRQTFLPSIFTSNEYIMNSAGPWVDPLTTPPPAVPASSPDVILY